MVLPAIAVEHLSKRYRLGRAGTSRRLLWDAVKGAFSRGAERLSDEETLWALEDVSFEVSPGEVVGIIGGNGAGKSTLLKILSRITPPTSGRAVIRGRVSSLLEVGTGFHPDLTGVENIYMNGSILGMTRGEISERFDEIVSFSGVERFLDTPLKRYSSGMQVRLAFAVAAHLDPEILIVDEVLAVGDAAFQRKCIGKMDEVATRSGRTVLFVSHNLSMVEALCTRGIVLREGSVVYDGPTSEAVPAYLTTLPSDVLDLADRSDRTGSGEVRILGIEINRDRAAAANTVRSGQALEFRLRFRAERCEFSDLRVGVSVRNQVDAPVFLQTNVLAGRDFNTVPSEGVFVCRIPEVPLVPARYSVTYSVVAEGRFVDRIPHAAYFDVVETDYFGSGQQPPAVFGPLLVRASWDIELEDG